MSSVTVCVPVYNGAAFLRETLAGIASQTFRDIRVLISDDSSTDASLRICEQFLPDSRFELIEQPSRLGWQGNVNALIARVQTEFFCITPHDDILHPEYISHVLAQAQRVPSASCVYSDIKGFGTSRKRIVQPEIVGDRLSRVLDMLLHHDRSVAFRGLVRLRDDSDRPVLPSMPGGYAADTAWLMTLALRGELRRVPATLYAKRYLPTSEHAQWPRLPRNERIRLRAVLAATCVRLANEVITSDEERQLVLAAGMLRVIGVGKAGGLGIPHDDVETVAALSAFLGEFEAPSLTDLQAALGSPLAASIREAIDHHRRTKARRALQRFVGRLLGRPYA